jgi:PAS domain S-box-containing protein
MAGLICGLLIVNHNSHTSLQQVNTQLFQQNLENAARSIGYFLSERENNIHSLANSNQVSGFFTNQALGMTMAYGLRASLNNIDRSFEKLRENSRLGATPIYTKLLLLGADGLVLTGVPNKDVEKSEMPATQLSGPKHVHLASQEDGLIIITCPVSQNERVAGYIQGFIEYRTLVEYLLNDIPGTLLISDGRNMVYQSHNDFQVTPSQLHALIGSRRPPLKLDSNQLGATTGIVNANSSYTLFQTTVAGYDLTLNVVEETSAIGQRQSQIYFMTILSVFSLGVFGLAIMMFRLGSKRIVLETSLAEATKREQVILEKKEEMELVLEGARLGTWCWYIDRGQIEFNERYWTMLGYTKGELPEQFDTWRELLHPQDTMRVILLLKAHLSGTIPFFSTEYRLRHKSGRWIWVHDSGKILQRDLTGIPLRAFGIHLDITDRKESSHLLAKAKEESDTIIRNFLDTLIVVNGSLEVTRVNQATCELLGYREQDLIGRQVLDLFHESTDAVQAAFAFYADEHRQGDQPLEELRNVELCYRHKNGARLPMSFNISLLKDDTGTVNGVIAGAKDVSHLHSALDKIARQKEYIETLFDIIPQGLLAISPAQQIVKNNRAYEHLITLWALRLNLSVDTCAKQFINKIITAQGQSETFIIHLQNGDVNGWFRCYATFISVLEGIASVIAIQDITNERQAEEEIRLLATVIEQTSDSVFIVGIDEIVQYVNPAAVNNSGYSTDELIGFPPPIYSSDLMDQATLTELRLAMIDGRSWHGPFRSRRKDGSIMEEDASISPVRNEEGQITCVVGVKRDITEKVNLQRQLLQAQKLEAIGQLAAGIAHEINSPMQYVQNNVSFFEQSFNDIHEILITIGQAERSSLPASIADMLNSIDLKFLLEELPLSLRETHEGINRVVKIVAAMKEFSHPGSSEKLATDLNQTLENTLIVCRNEWKYAAELVTDFAPDLPSIPCFPDQINQAILNLIINASHAILAQKQTTPLRQGQIIVRTRVENDSVVIHVEDNGCGIPADIQQRIFEPFFTTKEVGKGTGQGLAIVHDTIVKKHGGTIDFTTSPGEGTVFTICLPLAEV